MRYRWNRAMMVLLVGALAVAVLLAVSKPAASQNAKTPMTADGHPDFSGYWGGFGAQGSGGGSFPGEAFQRTADGSVLFDFSVDQGNDTLCTDDSCQLTSQPPYNAKYMAKVKQIANTLFAGTSPLDPMTQCKPLGVPRSGIGNSLIFQTPQMIAVMRGDYTDRVIYIDGRPHPADMESTYMGDSIGHWEGNTLVVDVAGLNDDTWLSGASFDFLLAGAAGKTKYTSIHSDKEHVTERWTREGDTITIQTTVEDPEAFTKPWVLQPYKVSLQKPGASFDAPIFCDGSGISELMRQHYVKPDPEDRDIKYKCAGHRCDPGTATANCGLANKQNCSH
jgi:hypothetical protein